MIPSSHGRVYTLQLHAEADILHRLPVCTLITYHHQQAEPQPQRASHPENLHMPSSPQHQTALWCVSAALSWVFSSLVCSLQSVRLCQWAARYRMPPRHILQLPDHVPCALQALSFLLRALFPLAFACPSRQLASCSPSRPPEPPHLECCYAAPPLLCLSWPSPGLSQPFHCLSLCQASHQGLNKPCHCH